MTEILTKSLKKAGFTVKSFNKITSSNRFSNTEFSGHGIIGIFSEDDNAPDFLHNKLIVCYEHEPVLWSKSEFVWNVCEQTVDKIVDEIKSLIHLLD